MARPADVLARLEAIGQSLAQSGQGLALIGLGSVGLERDRLDAYSDLDFFAIVKPGSKASFLNNLHWLSAIAPVAYTFQNTPDGYKLLFADGIFCEFAVFEPDELANIPFAEGQIVWKAAEVADSIGQPILRTPQATPPAQDWLIGEALTCLYVGLNRYWRGEKLSAYRFIQEYALMHMLAFVAQIEAPVGGQRDQFAPERRFEQRFPTVAPHLAAFLQGYERSRESARAILAFLSQHVPINPSMHALIEALCGDEQPSW